MNSWDVKEEINDSGDEEPEEEDDDDDEGEAEGSGSRKKKVVKVKKERQDDEDEEMARDEKANRDGNVPSECPAMVTFFVLYFAIAFCTAARTPGADL